MPFFTDTFMVFIGFALIHSTPQSLDNPALSSPHALLLTKGKAVGDHGDELGIRRFSFYVRHGVAEEFLQCFDGIYCFVHGHHSDAFIGFVLMISTIKKCVKRQAYKL